MLAHRPVFYQDLPVGNIVCRIDPVALASDPIKLYIMTLGVLARCSSLHSNESH